MDAQVTFNIYSQSPCIQQQTVRQYQNDRINHGVYHTITISHELNVQHKLSIEESDEGRQSTSIEAHKLENTPTHSSGRHESSQT